MVQKMDRRKFLKTSSMAAAGLATAGLISPKFAKAANHQPLGLQLYTVRAQAVENLPDTLARVRAIGFEQVETCGDVYVHPAKELRSIITNAGLTVPSGHFSYADFEAKFDYAKELGIHTMICPMVDGPMQTAAGFRQAAEQFNRWGEKLKSLGMQFAFHNHNYEFHALENGEGTGWEILMAHTDPALVKLEMDCYWITQSGNDPLAMLHKYKDRVGMLHVKDRKAGFPPSQELVDAASHFTEVGSGTIPWKTILPAAQAQGIRYFFVEQDSTEVPVFESLQRSYSYLRTILA